MSLLKFFIVFYLSFSSFLFAQKSYKGMLGDSLGVSTNVNESIFRFNSHDNKNSRDWTIMVYMDGDNDLEEFALKDLNEMESAIEDNIDIIVLIDRSKKYTKKDGDWSDARVYRVKKDNDLNKINSELLQNVGEVNMGDKRVLEGFVSSVLNNFKAKHYALIMWNHGGGWVANAIDYDAPNSESKRDSLTLSELSSAIKAALDTNGINKLDLLGFDMCLMSQMEVAYEVKDLFKVMVASEANEPGDGWPYSKVLPEFAKGTQGARGIATSIVNSYNKFYLQRGEPLYTLAALDLTMFDSVLNSFSEITNKMLDSLDGRWSLLSRALFFSEAYQPRIEDINRGKNAIASIDMMDALNSAIKSSKLKHLESDYEKLVDIMDRFILSSANSNSKQRSNGIAIYTPVLKNNYNGLYANNKFATDSNWNKFLNKLHTKQTQNSTTPKILDINLVSFKDGKTTPIDSVIPMQTTGFKYKVEGKGILWIQGMYGLKSNNGGLVALKVGTVLNVGGSLLEKREKKNIADKIDMYIPDYKDGLNEGNLYFDGLYYLLLADGKYSFATVITPLDSPYLIVPITYESKKYGKFDGNIYFDNRIWDAVNVEIYIPQQDGTIATRFIKPEADDNITLELMYLSKEGKQSYVKGRSFLWKNGCELVLDRFDKGDYVLGLNVQSFSGVGIGKLYEFNVKLNSVLEGAIASIAKNPYKLDDFVGSWEKIDADAFMNGGKIVKKGYKNIYNKSKDGTYLVCFVGKSNAQTYEKAYNVLADFKLFPHMRYIKIEDKKQTNSVKDIDSFKVLFTMLYKFPNRYVMIQQDTLTYKFNVYVKELTTKETNNNSAINTTNNAAVTNNSNNTQNTTAPNTTLNSKLDGAWQAADGERVYFSNGEYKIVQNGSVISQGIYRVNGNYIYLKDINTKREMAFSFMVNGNNLLMQSSDGQRFLYSKIIQNSNTNYSGVNNTNYNSTSKIAQDYAALNGIWQMPGVAVLIVQGNNYQTYEGGIMTDRGVFELRANNILISKSLTRGFTYQYHYRISGDIFDLIDAQGKVYRYFRSR